MQLPRNQIKKTKFLDESINHEVKMGLFDSIFRKKNAIKMLRDAEIREVGDALDDVFYSNFTYLKESSQWSMYVHENVSRYPELDIEGLFILGVVRRALIGRPALPVLPDDRALVHILKFFLKGKDNILIEEERARAVAIGDTFVKANPLVLRIVQFGEQAFVNRDGHYLLDAHHAAWMKSTGEVW